jgi:hypothetical protein
VSDSGVDVQQGDLVHDQVNREAVLEGWGAGPGARFSAIAQVDTFIIILFTREGSVALLLLLSSDPRD